MIIRFVAAEMMPDQASIVLFIAATTVLSCVAAFVLPPFFRRLTLRQAVPVLALIGPVLAVAGSLIGSVAMILSGRDVGYVLMVAVITGVAAIVVGWRLARPLAADLDSVASTVDAIAGGDRSRQTGLTRHDELGALAATVDELGRTLARSEAERDAAEDERRSVVNALSHDLRTPLASLLASVEALQDGVGSQDDHLPAMRRNVLALERLVEDLFLLARADSGSLALHPEMLDLAELIDEAIEAVGPAAAEREVQLVAKLSTAIPVQGDDSALGRVLRNLLDNAIRHSPHGGSVEVVTVSSGDTVLVDLIDQGEGFDAEFAPQAFQRFTQADDARSRLGGAGLGLAIAQTLIEAHDGDIAIKPGPGGRIRIRLPLIDRALAHG
jgi:two-component system sensor histidine kinase BaeS